MDPALFRTDIEAKPAALRALAGALAAAGPDGLWTIPDGIRRVVFLGMGSSRYAAQVAALRMRAAGFDAVAEYASARAAYPPDPATLAVAISATGGSRETLDAATAYAGSGRLIAVTNTPGSPLTAMAGSVVPLHAGVEAGGVSCRTFQHTLVLLIDLAARLAGRPSDAAGLALRAADATADLLRRRPEWLPGVLELLDGPDGVYTMAPAERLSSAMQSALMFREGPRRPGTGCETGDWSHVDVYLTKTLSYRALLFPGSRYDAPALDWLKQRESTIVAVGADVDGAHAVVRYAGDDDEDVRLLTEVTVAEVVSAHWWEQAEAG